MNKWIRWQGLIPFVVCVVLIGLFWFFLVDFLIERGIEKAGTKALGARVDLASADLSIFPLGLALNGLQVTDPDSPMENVVEIGSMRLKFETGPLFLRKVVVRDIAVDDVRFNTPRKVSGAIKKTSSAQKTAQPTMVDDALGNLTNLSLPKVKEILEKENLKTLALVESFKTDLTGLESHWKTKLDTLPNEKKLKDLQARVEALSKTKGDVVGILGAGAETLALQNEIKTELAALQSAQTDLKKELTSYKTRLDALQKAPLEDLERLKNKYSLSGRGMANISRILFGPKIAIWIDRVFIYQDKLAPYFPKPKEKGEVEVRKRAKGVEVRFQDHRPLPDFVIKQGTVSVHSPVGLLAGKINDITFEQALWGRPSTMAFQWQDKGQAFDLLGVIDHRNPTATKDELNVGLQGFPLKDIELSDQVPVVISKAVISGQAKVALSNGQILAKASIKLNKGAYQLRQGQENKILEKVTQILSGADALTLEVGLSGTKDKYDLNLTSNVDKLLASGVMSLIQEETAKFTAELKAAVFNQTNGPLADAQKALGGFGPLSKELESRLGLAQNILSSASGGGKDKGLKLPF